MIVQPRRPPSLPGTILGPSVPNFPDIPDIPEMIKIPELPKFELPNITKNLFPQFDNAILINVAIWILLAILLVIGIYKSLDIDTTDIAKVASVAV